MSGAAMRFSAAIQRIGREASLLRGEQRIPFLASLQPRLGTGEAEAGPLGAGDIRYHTLYAAADSAATAMQPGETVAYGGGRYRVCRVQEMEIGGETAYLWAVVRPETDWGEADGAD